MELRDSSSIPSAFVCSHFMRSSWLQWSFRFGRPCALVAPSDWATLTLLLPLYPLLSSATAAATELFSLRSIVVISSLCPAFLSTCDRVFLVGAHGFNLNLISRIRITSPVRWACGMLTYASTAAPLADSHRTKPSHTHVRFIRICITTRYMETAHNSVRPHSYRLN